MRRLGPILCVACGYACRVYMRVCTHMYACTHVFMYACMHVCVCLAGWARSSALPVGMHAECPCVYVHVCVHVCVGLAGWARSSALHYEKCMHVAHMYVCMYASMCVSTGHSGSVCVCNICINRRSCIHTRTHLLQATCEFIFLEYSAPHKLRNKLLHV